MVDAWARDLGLGGIGGCRSLFERWKNAVARSLSERPPRTKAGWGSNGWAELAKAFAPSASKSREKRFLRELLLSDGSRLGALSAIWQLQAQFDDEDFREEILHDRLQKRVRGYRPLLEAIRAYEAFARGLQNAFDVLKAEAARFDAHGFDLSLMAGDGAFRKSVRGLHKRFAAAHRALGALNSASFQLLLKERFSAFAEPMDALDYARALCGHHERIHRAKSAAGKRPWFDRIGDDRIYIRHQYREPRREILPGQYVHPFRGWPIRRFCRDLS